MISTTPDGVITRWSPAAERMLGYSATEVISRPIFTIIPPSLVDKERALMSRLAEDGRTVRHGTVRVHKGGRPLDVAATLSPVRDATGTTVEILSIARDLTEQKGEELVRRESEERFRLIADATPVMIKSTGINGEFDFVNKAYLDFTGRRMDETLGNGLAAGSSTPRTCNIASNCTSPPSASGDSSRSSSGFAAMTVSTAGFSTLACRASTLMVDSLVTSAHMSISRIDDAPKNWKRVLRNGPVSQGNCTILYCKIFTQCCPAFRSLTSSCRRVPRRRENNSKAQSTRPLRRSPKAGWQCKGCARLCPGPPTLPTL